MKKLIAIWNDPRIARFRTRKVGIGIAIVVLALFIGRIGKKPSVALAPIEVKENYTLKLEVETELRPGEEFFLSVKQGGKLDHIFVQAGQLVPKGKILAVIDEVAHRSALSSALSGFRLASVEFSRMSQLYRSGSVTMQEYDQARTTYDVRKAELEQSKQKMEDSVVRSPVDGFLSLLPFKEGDFVPEGSRVAVVEDRSRLSASLRIDAREGKLLENRATVELIAPGDPETRVAVPAEVRKHELAAGLMDASMDVVFEFTGLPEAFQPGKKVKLIAPLKTFPSLVLIDSSAIVWSKGFPQVALLGSDMTVSWFGVEIGSRIEGKVSVLNLDGKAKVVSPTDPAKMEKLIRKKSRVAVAPAASRPT